MNSARSKFSTLQQKCTYIPGPLVAKLTRKYGVNEQIPQHPKKLALAMKAFR